MRLTLEMPEVGDCLATECAYNVDTTCHARAITIGSDMHPACDTYLRDDHHVQNVVRMAGVGACKVSGCCHNEDLECTASAIRITHHGDHAECATFAPSRPHA